MVSRAPRSALVAFGLGLSFGLSSPTPLAAAGSFIRADTNQDGEVDVSDAVFLLLHLFGGEGSVRVRCLDSADANDDGLVNVSDAIYLLNHLFKAGPPPPAPYPDCGVDPGGASQGCLRFDPCGTLPEPFWESLGGPPGAGRCTLIQSTTGGHKLYASTRRGVYRSDDKGASWQALEPPVESELFDMAAFGDKLFVCPLSGLLVYDGSGPPTDLLFGPWRQVEITGGKLCVVSAAGEPDDLQFLLADPTADEPEWDDVSPSATELQSLAFPAAGSGLVAAIEVPAVFVAGDTILAGIMVTVGGQGNLDNGGLFGSFDSGATWDRMTLGAAADGLVVARIVPDPGDASRVLALLTDRVADTGHPLSDLVWESRDGGNTWASATTLTYEAEGITDADIVGSATYLVGSASLDILRVEGAQLTMIDLPKPPGFERLQFGLETLHFDPDAPGTVYGQTGRRWELGLVKSIDGLSTWTKMDAGIVSSSPTIVVVHPGDSQTLFTSSNIVQESYVTRDGGTSWEPFSPTYSDDEVRVDPHDPDHLYIISELTGLWESFDGGRTFGPVNSKFTSAKIFDFEIAKSGSQRIYVSNLGTGISTLGSEPQWSYLQRSPDYAYDLEIDPDHDEVIYATNSPKKFESHSSIWKYSPDTTENSGWTELLKLEGTAGITALEIDPQDPDNLYAGVIGTRGMVYWSDDRGVTWKRLAEEFTFVTIHELAIDPRDDAVVYAAPWGGGLFRSTDHGTSWTELDAPTVSISSIVVDPVDSSRLLIGDRTAPRVYESVDRGASWHPYVELDDELHYRVFAMALHDGKLYLSVMNRAAGLLALFTDPLSGSSFRIDPEGPTPLAGAMTRVALELYSNGTELYGVSHIRGVFRLDGGVWVDISEHLPDMGFNTIIAGEGSTLYVAGGCDLDVDLSSRIGDAAVVNQVYTSDDPELAWTPLLSGDPFQSGIKKLLRHPDDGSVWFAATGAGLFVSTQSGAAGSWTSQNAGLGFQGIGDMALASDHVYVGTLGGGVYVGDIAADYSVSWRPSTGPLPTIYNVQIRIDPADSEVLYASSYPGGVFNSTDGGSTWNERNFGLPSFPVLDPALQGYYSLEIAPEDTDTLYLGISGKGVYKSTNGGGTWRPMYGLFGQNREIMRKSITQLRVDPTDSERVYLGTREGVYMSTDGAESWSPLNTGLDTLDVLSLRVSGGDGLSFEEGFEGDLGSSWELEPGWTVAEQAENHVLRGTGHSWARFGNVLWSDYTLGMRVKIHQGMLHANVRVSDDGRYFVGVHQGGLYLKKQFDGWTQFADLAESTDPLALGVWHTLEIEVDGGTIRVRVEGIPKLEFQDSEPLITGAIAFETLAASTVEVDDVSIAVTRGPARLYAGTAGYGLYVYDAETGKWRNLGRTLGTGWWDVWERRMYQFSSLLFDELEPGRVYLGHFPGGFFISEDNGQNWRDSSLGLGNDGIFSLVMHPQERHILFAGTYNGVWKSVDRGLTWESKSVGIPDEQWPYTIAFDVENPQVMYVTTKNGQKKGFCSRNEFCGVVMKSLDGAESWTEIMVGLDRKSEFYVLLIHPENGSVLFLSTSRGVYMSRDAGTSWEASNEGLPTTVNQVRENVAQNLTFTNDYGQLLLGLMGYGVWKADLSRLQLGP